jgi:N-methylhydantoinase A
LKEGIAENDISYQRSADMRYTGQEYTINVLISAAIDLSTTKSDFHASYQLRYGHSNPAAPVEFVNLRVAALGAVDKFAQSNDVPGTDGEIAAPGERNTVFNGVEHKTPVLSRDSLRAGFSSRGPIIIEEHSATTVVPPDWLVKVDAQGNILMHRESQR